MWIGRVRVAIPSLGPCCLPRRLGHSWDASHNLGTLEAFQTWREGHSRFGAPLETSGAPAPEIVAYPTTSRDTSAHTSGTRTLRTPGTFVTAVERSPLPLLRLLAHMLFLELQQPIRLSHLRKTAAQNQAVTQTNRSCAFLLKPSLQFDSPHGFEVTQGLRAQQAGCKKMQEDTPEPLLVGRAPATVPCLHAR